jgi:hypothetical protein
MNLGRIAFHAKPPQPESMANCAIGDDGRALDDFRFESQSFIGDRDTYDLAEHASISTDSDQLTGVIDAHGHVSR